MDKTELYHKLEREMASLAIDTEGYLVGYAPEIDDTFLYRFSLPSAKGYE